MSVEFTLECDGAEIRSDCSEDGIYSEEVLECSFWSPLDDKWATEGCTTVDTRFYDDGRSQLDCVCTHLTTFSMIRNLRETDDTDDVCGSETQANFGYAPTVIFTLLYSMIAAISLVQLFRFSYYMRAPGGTKAHHNDSDANGGQRNVNIVHFLLFVVCACNMSWLVLYYSNDKSLSEVIIVLMSIPLAVMYWIFSTVIYTWAKIFHYAQVGSSNKQFKQVLLSHLFRISNLLVTVALICMVILLLTSEPEDETFRKVALSGSIVIAAVRVVTAILFTVYGVLLVRSIRGVALECGKESVVLKQTINRIFKIASVLSCALIVESVIVVVSAVQNGTAFSQNFVVMQSVYFSTNLVGLVVVLMLNRNHVKKASIVHSESSSGNNSHIKETSSFGSKLKSWRRYRSRSGSGTLQMYSLHEKATTSCDGGGPSTGTPPPSAGGRKLSPSSTNNSSSGSSSSEPSFPEKEVKPLVVQQPPNHNNNALTPVASNRSADTYPQNDDNDDHNSLTPRTTDSVRQKRRRRVLDGSLHTRDDTESSLTSDVAVVLVKRPSNKVVLV